MLHLRGMHVFLPQYSTHEDCWNITQVLIEDDDVKDIAILKPYTSSLTEDWSTLIT